MDETKHEQRIGGAAQLFTTCIDVLSRDLSVELENPTQEAL